MSYADSKTTIDDTISPCNSNGAAAKSVAGISTPQKSQGDKAPALMLWRFFSVRSSCYGRPDGPRKGAASLCAVVLTRPVGLHSISTECWPKAKAQGTYTMTYQDQGAPAPCQIDQIDRIQALISEARTACDLISDASHHGTISANALDLLVSAISDRLTAIHAESQAMASGLHQNVSVHAPVHDGGVR